MGLSLPLSFLSFRHYCKIIRAGAYVEGGGLDSARFIYLMVNEATVNENGYNANELRLTSLFSFLFLRDWSRPSIAPKVKFVYPT